MAETPQPPQGLVDDPAWWLRVQLDEDERAGTEGLHRQTTSRRMAQGQMVDVPVQPMPEWRRSACPPERLLREVEAKRRRLERHERLTAFGQPDRCRWCGRDVFVPWPCPDVRDDLAVYADRPGYREEWRPT